MSDNLIILVGCDRDLIFDTDHLASSIIGYTASQQHDDIGYEYFGEIRNFKIEDEKIKLLVTVDDIPLRRWISDQFPNNLFTYISPRARVSPEASVSAGAVIQSGCFVSAGCSISTLVKVNVGCQIHHDSVISAYSVLAPSVVLLGHAQIGEASYIGAGSIVRQALSVGKNCTIGMGSIITKNIPKDSQAFGNPCRLKSLQRSPNN